MYKRQELTFSITLSEAAELQLTVSDALGKRLHFISQKLEAGIHELNFDASYLVVGTYFYQLTTGDRSFTGKVVKVNE